MNTEYAKLGLAAIALIVTCIVSISKPEAVSVIERIASIVASGSLGAVGQSSLTKLSTQEKSKKEED